MALSWFSPDSDGAFLKIRVQPRAGRTEVVGPHGSALKIRLAAPPVDGAANTALVAFLAKRLGRPKASVEIRRGHKGRIKSVWVQGLDEQTARAALTDEG